VAAASVPRASLSVAASPGFPSITEISIPNSGPPPPQRRAANLPPPFRLDAIEPVAEPVARVARSTRRQPSTPEPGPALSEQALPQHPLPRRRSSSNHDRRRESEASQPSWTEPAPPIAPQPQPAPVVVRTAPPQSWGTASPAFWERRHLNHLRLRIMR
jgi:hypothetical protein